MSFLEIERRLVARKSLGTFSIRDRRVRYISTLLVAYACVGFLGSAALFFFIAQGIFAFCMLEVVNYA